MRILPLFLVACGEYLCLAEGETLDAGLRAPAAGNVDLSASTELRHFGLDGLLRLATVEGAGPYGGRGVDYDGVLASTEATAALEGYLAGLATVDPANLVDSAERFAYWLNAYNAWALYAVAGKVAEDPDYDVESDGWLLFSTKFVAVGEHLLSPNDIEHGVLRGWSEQPYGDDDLAAAASGWHQDLWDGGPPDARLHVGLNCASASCPDLPPGAFRGDRLDEQLDASAEAFLANEQKGAGADGVSTLFSWFAGDFEASHGSVEAFVSAYRDDGDVAYGTYLPYDWSLNAADTPAGGVTCASPW